MLIKKHQPKTLNEIKGQDSALNKLKSNVLKNKPVLIHGETGNGKTSSVYALANELNYEILEVNASDTRNKDQINSIIGNAAKQQSLFNKSKIILVDEIDGINIKDRGGLESLNKLLENSYFPMVLVANNPWHKKFNSVRKKCEMIEFEKLNYSSVYEIIKDICEKEKIKFNDDSLKSLARKVNGDARAAINNLQILIEGNKLVDMELDDRDKKDTIFNILKLIFKSKDPELVLGALNLVNENIDECFLWLEENIPREYSKESLRNAYNALSKADVFRGRISRQQYYRFLYYQIVLMTLGVSLAKTEKYPGFVNYQRNKRILKYYIYNMKNAKKKALASEIAERMHISTKKALKELPYMGFIEYK